MASDRCVSRLLPALGLALGLLGCTCAPPPEYGEYSGYSEEVDRGKESHEQTTTTFKSEYGEYSGYSEEVDQEKENLEQTTNASKSDYGEYSGYSEEVDQGQENLEQITNASKSEYGEYSGYSIEVDKGQESHVNMTTTASDFKNEPLTPSEYIREFVETVFRGDADEMLDSGEKLRPANLTANNPGFQQYWPQGEWAVTQDQMQSCNTSVDACSDLYVKYGPVCASDLMNKHSTFDTWCELQDNNCRDGTATVWTINWQNASEITWFRVSKSPIYIYAMMFNIANIVLSPTNAVIGTQNYIVSIGGNNPDARTTQTIQLRKSVDNWQTYLSVLIFDWYNQKDIYSVWGNVVQPYRFEFNSTTGWMRFTLLRPDIKWADRNIAYQDSVNKKFDVNFIGVGGGNKDSPIWWYMTAWLPVYRGACKEELPTLPTDIPSKLRDKINIDLYNFAGRMDEFGYNFTRVWG